MCLKKPNSVARASKKTMNTKISLKAGNEGGADFFFELVGPFPENDATFLKFPYLNFTNLLSCFLVTSWINISDVTMHFLSLEHVRFLLLSVFVSLADLSAPLRSYKTAPMQSTPIRPGLKGDSFILLKEGRK